LLVNGIGPASWPNFNALAETPSVLPPKSVVSGAAYSSGVKVEPPPLEGIARQVVDMLDRKRQVILYGPPGTGKTYHAERIALEVIARHNFNCLPSQLSDRQRDMAYGRGGTDPYIATCTFHPMYSYEDFIEGYRPNGEGFKLEPGIFKKMVTAAQAQPAKRFVLIIDEINRGNIPKIFGELITLIETSKRATTSSLLPLSKEPFTVTDNLLVIGTMNTADRSILLLDTALRRRFAFKELLPEPHLLRTGAIADVALSTWLRALNRRIVEQLGRDGRNLQVGHAYLMPGGKPAATISRIGEIVRDELWPLLQEYCYEDPNKLANILAADKGGVFDRDTANLRFELFEPGREDALAQALTAIVTPDDKKHDAVLGEDLPDDEDLEEQHDYEGPKA
jgi:5-methylcytosine-specific restriction protein B